MDFRKLILFRTKKELTQREIAALLNVSKSTYARWETQEEIVPLSRLMNICDFFKISIDYLLGLDKNNNYSEYDYSKKLDKSKIGNNIKSIRKKYKLTQNDLAKILNTSQSTISAYESGKTLVLTAFVYSVASEFNISMDELCDRIPEKDVVKQ